MFGCCEIANYDDGAVAGETTIVHRDGAALLVLRVTEDGAAAIPFIRADPTGRGHGTAALRRLRPAHPRITALNVGGGALDRALPFWRRAAEAGLVDRVVHTDGTELWDGRVWRDVL